ncbi:MAG: AAA ATPase [Stictis urceolatum]|nr:AAA ATPase [Stictis urceolata]
MTRNSILGKRKNDSQASENLQTRKRRVLRSSLNDENADPEILCDVFSGTDELEDPFTPSKGTSKIARPAKHAGSAHRVAFSPVKINGYFKASKPVAETVEKSQLPTPQTPRHRDAFVKPETPRRRVQVATKLPLTPRTPRTPGGSATTVYNAARQLFVRSSVPGQLVGRETERAQLKSFLEDGVAEKSGRSLYISGPPGTGKSAFARQECDELKDQKDVRVAHVNCMSIKSSKDLVNNLVRELSEEEADAGKDGVNVLKSIVFPRQGEDKVYVLTLDEIDHILTLDIEILYTIFEWALNPASRLILVGIANALDLTDRFLPRLKSRSLKPQLLPFVPYTVTQIASVITARLKTLSSHSSYVPFVHPTAIQFCAKKVASQTGDLRKAFDLIRRLIEVVEIETKAAQQPQGSPLSENNNLSTPSTSSRGTKSDPLAHLTPETAPRATISHAARVAASAFNNGTAQRLKTLNLQQKAALCSLLALEKKSEATRKQLAFSTPSKSASQPPNVRKLFDVYSDLCKREGKLAPLQRNEFSDVVGSLEGLGLIREADVRGGLKGRKEDRGVVSAVSEKEVEGCLEGVVGGLLMGLLKGDD